MATFSFDDLSYIQMLNTLNNRINDALNNSDDQGQNTVMQYFEAPVDQVTLLTTVQSWVNGTSISVTNRETVTLTVTTSSTVTDPSTEVWGDSVNGGNWIWGANGVWN